MAKIRAKQHQAKFYAYCDAAIQLTILSSGYFRKIDFSKYLNKKRN